MQLGPITTDIIATVNTEGYTIGIAILSGVVVICCFTIFLLVLVLLCTCYYFKYG